ncbi:hypothetical protein GGS24DRAFT_472468 [Hypoxylon argillaceum]|nr:hypothetical protein GGS24DRAFT_472468 [Hypoxylon argillaceum]
MSGLPSLKRAYPFEGENPGYTHIQTTSRTWDFERHESIYFGSIIDVKVQLYNMDILTNCPNSAVLSFDIAQEGEFFALKNGEGKFARLNKELCKQLLKLVPKQKVRLQAYVSTDDGNRHAPNYILAEINIYGARADARDVGAVLS